MSISVLVGHTGQRLALDPSVASCSSIDQLRAWITDQTGISLRSQILLSAHGKQVRPQTLLTEHELFVFDSSYLTGSKATTYSSNPLNNIDDNNDFSPSTAPDTITNQNDLQAWQRLFRLRKSWAADLLNGCSTRAKQVDQFQDEQNVIERSLAVAVASLQQHIKSAEKHVASAEMWASDVLQQQQAHADNWEHNLGTLRSIPARPEFTRFIQPMQPTSGSRRASQQHISTLQGFVDVITVKQAASSAKSLIASLEYSVDTKRDDLEDAAKHSSELSVAVEQLHTRSSEESTSEPTQLVHEIELVVNKMTSDHEHVQSLSNTTKDLSQISKMALLSTRSYVPNLIDYCSEMNDLARRAKQQRDDAANTALGHMRTLSTIESQLAKLYQDIKELEIPEDQQQAFATLSIVSRLPSVYGQLLVEAVRRREWVAKMKRDSGTLQEEVALYQEEEEKRRKKWVRAVDDVVPPEALVSRVLGIELNLQNEGGSWPMTTREELTEYLKALHDVYGEGPVTDEIDQAIKDLDKPTRKQIKHARAFKNGSMHEAAFGDTSLLLRGDEQYKTLRETNTRLDEELKAQKSRVRKLEDLLHRQTQMSRASTGDVFTPASEGPSSLRGPTALMAPSGSTTPQPFDISSRNSFQAQNRRHSLVQNQGMEEKRLAKRIVDLEAELQSHKEEISSRKNSDVEFQKQVEEATSTKKDLMENMDAQQREFATERRNLEKDLAEAKERIEETENEMERLAGSREGIEEEITRLKEDAADRIARAASEHDTRNDLQRRLEVAETARVRAESELQRLRTAKEKEREVEAEHMHSLATAHAHLAPESDAPNGLVDLTAALEELSRKSAAHAKDLAEAVAFAKSENESLWSSNERQKSELTSASLRQAEVEGQVREVQEKLAAEVAKAGSLTEQLNDEHDQLRMLRSKFADGETGSEVLRQRVAGEEAKARSLTSELAEAKSHINSLDVELMRLQKKHKAYHTSAEASSLRLEKRAERAREISHRLYTQNTRLARLLERLGLAVSYQGETMTIERASKMAGSTTILDPHLYLSRQVSTSSPPPTRKSSAAESDAGADLRLAYWPDAQSLEEETTQYEGFMSHIARFDLDVFADAVTKRVKDFEYTAKKYSKEAKETVKRADAYKDRAVRLKSEAQGKIAVRDFKEGDLALFLPTRGGQVKGAWAAFNIGCPHYFLAEREGMRLGTRDFIVARIQKVEQKIVDLSNRRATSDLDHDSERLDESGEAVSSMHVEDDNPFDLSDGLTWWMVHASEERGMGAAPITPGLGKSTVAAANVDARGSIKLKRDSKGGDASKHLNKSLESRRSSSASKKGFTVTSPTNTTAIAVAVEETRSRSQSQASSLGQQPLRPLPQVAASGLGISTAQAVETSSDPTSHEQIRHLPATEHTLADEGLRPYTSDETSPGKSRARSQSPSKSVRSLQKHLAPPPKETRSPLKAKPKSGWESLFSAEFSLESPTKEKKSFT